MWSLILIINGFAMPFSTYTDFSDCYNTGTFFVQNHKAESYQCIPRG